MMPDCLNCNKNVRQEIYDSQWGMFYFMNKCSVGVSIIKDGKINPFGAECDKFEYGKPKTKPMSEKEKQKY